MDPLEVQGLAPELAGKVCEGLICHEHWHEDSLVEPADIVFIRSDGVWHKLFFDSGIVFWKSDVQPESSFDAPEIASMFRRVDLGQRFGFVGRRIASCKATPITGGAQVLITFQGGGSIAFRSVDDVTSYVAA